MSENDRLTRLEERYTHLQNHVVEQDRVILELSEALERVRKELAALRDPDPSPGEEVADQIAVDAWSDFTVLVVDDDDSVREVVVDMLRRLGFQVLTATDGAEGIDVFRRNVDRISLVLLDMAMPRVNGEEAFRAIRNLKSDARVILCSGYSEQETTARVAGEGLAGFLQKPYVLSTLRDAIREVLER